MSNFNRPAGGSLFSNPSGNTATGSLFSGKLITQPLLLLLCLVISQEAMVFLHSQEEIIQVCFLSLQEEILEDFLVSRLETKACFLSLRET